MRARSWFVATGAVAIASVSLAVGGVGASREVRAEVAGPNVGGIISTDTVWTTEGSPYHVTSTVQVPAGVTLTINPGVQVLSGGVARMFLMYGTISAIGTATDPITFDGAGDSNFFAAESAPPSAFLDLAFAKVQNGNSFWPATGTSQPAYFHVRDSTFDNVRGGSHVWYPEHDVFIERNRFTNSAGFGVVHSGASVYVRWNRFESRPTTLPSYEDFWVANYAAYGSSQTIVKYNSFLSPGHGAVELPTGYSNAAMDATQNYWGTTNESVIQAMILDANDDITRASVIPYAPILSAPDPETRGAPPDAPTNAVAFAYSTAVVIVFAPPVNDGGKPITQYVVTEQPGGRTGVGSGSPIVVTDLMPGTHVFSVTAVNAEGESPPSDPSNIVLTTSLPVTVRWTAAEHARLFELVDFYDMPEDQLTSYGVYVLAFINAIDPSPTPTPVVLAPPGNASTQKLIWHEGELPILESVKARWVLNDEDAHRWGFIVLSFIAAIQGH